MKTAQRKEYLAALGLESWAVRRPAAAGAGSADPSAVVANDLPPTPAALPEPHNRLGVSTAAALASGPSERPGVGRAASEAMPAVSTLSTHTGREADYDWTQLRERVAGCTRCGLCATRTQTVFGVGNVHADWLIVGEAPGAEEDARGEPFVGRAGQLLNAMLRAIGLAREQVYIANVLKCRPPQNRDPASSETTECLPFLQRQIELLQPKILLVVGRIAAQNLLETTAPLGRLRQQVHSFGASRVPVVVTYHPAYLLRAPADKRKSWEDLKFAREVCGRG